MPNSLSLLTLGLVGALAASAPPASPAVGETHQPCGTHVVAGDADNGSAVCVVAGSDVSILLLAPAGASWSTPAVTGEVLGPAMPLPTPYGRVGWQFSTIAAGAAEISATRTTGCREVRYDLRVTVR